MTEVKCEECRSLQEDYLNSKTIDKVFGINNRDSKWIIVIDGHEYTMSDARGDISVNSIAMHIKSLLDARSYSHKRIK